MNAEQHRRNLEGRLLKAVFPPVRGLRETARLLGVTRTAVWTAENKIFHKIAVRMRDPNFYGKDGRA